MFSVCMFRCSVLQRFDLGLLYMDTGLKLIALIQYNENNLNKLSKDYFKINEYPHA